MYLTFVEYKEMGGTLEEAAFQTYLRRAESYINAQASGRTGERIKNLEIVPVAVRECIVELIELYVRQESRNITGVNRTVGGMSESISYGAVNSADAETEKYDVISRWFYGNGLGDLLYLGGEI